MKFITGDYTSLNPDMRQALFSYRHKVFIEQLGWELDTPEGLERDQFDHDDTLYVIAKDDQQHIVGCARLLPTTDPYLLEEVFPELLNGQTPPKDPSVWELSRFSAFDLNANDLPRPGQFSSEVTVDLLKNALKYAKDCGATQVISVSPIGVERLLRRAGFRAHRAGPPKIIDGYPLIACIIPLSDNHLQL